MNREILILLEKGSAPSGFSVRVQVLERRQSWTDVCSPGSREDRACGLP